MLPDIVDWLSTIPHCRLYGQPVLAAMHLVGDGGTFLAYMAIPTAIEIVRRKRGLPFDRLAMMFGAFIFLCGFGHLLETVAMFQGGAWIWLESSNKLLTALVSLATAAYIFRIIPTLLFIPTPAEWTEANRLIEFYRLRERKVNGLPAPNWINPRGQSEPKTYVDNPFA